MKTESIFFAVMILAAIGVVVFGMKPKVCIDNANGNARTTYRIFPCSANETAVVV